MDSVIITFINSSLNSMESTPGIISMGLGLVFLFLAYRLKNKKLTLDEYTTIGQSRSQQLNDLKDLVKMMGEELKLARGEINELASHNNQLRNHIANLEVLLTKNGIINEYESKILHKNNEREAS